MPYNSGTGAYERRTTTVIDATPDGDTVAVAIDVKLDTAADDAVLDLNHHKTNGNHFPATSVASDSRYLDQSPAGVVSWKDGVVAANAALKDMSNVASGAIAPAKIAQDASNRFVTDAEKALWFLPVYDARRGYNHIINGNFDIWQRGTSQTTGGYGSVDRWSNNNTGSSKVYSRQNFANGEVFPDGTPCPIHFARTVVTSVTSTLNHVMTRQKIEDVRRLAGKRVTLAFYAKADAPKNLAIEFSQEFGTGGSPSASVSGIGAQKVALTTVWQRFVVTADIPSISGKTLGTNGDHNLGLLLWFDAGTTYDARTDSLGHQSGTFDIACVSLVEGDVDVKPIPRSIGEEMALCQRYYYTAMCILACLDFGGSVAVNHRSFPVTMRAVPVIEVTAAGGTGGAFMAVDTNTFYQSSLNSIASDATIKADAEL